MAKQRQVNSIVSSIKAVTAALRLESIPNPTPEQLQEIHDAKVLAANVIDNSNFVTMVENVDDAIELQHQIAEQEEIEQAQIAQQEIEQELGEPAPPEPENEL